MIENPVPARRGRRSWIVAGVFALIPVVVLAAQVGWVMSSYTFFSGQWTGPYGLMKPAYSSIFWAPFILGAGVILGIGIIVWLGIRYKLKWPKASVAGVIGYALACVLYAMVMFKMTGLVVFGFYPERELSRQDTYGNTYIIATGSPAFYDGSYFLLVECQSAWRCKMIEEYKGPHAHEDPTLELDDPTQTVRLHVEPFSP
ncbi:MAG: hypothetical protein JXA21_17080 [Anaerolineae bacterium]|nr:hypothetical protein [Anaerolineae bacterium]